jgi:hypothetical protein
MSEPRIAYTARRDATAEIEYSTLAHIYKFVLDCHAKKEAAPENRPDDARKDQDARTTQQYTR